MEYISTLAGNIAFQAGALADLLDKHLIEASPRIVLRFEVKDLDKALALRTLLERKFEADARETETFTAAFTYRNVQIWVTCLAKKYCQDHQARGVGDLRSGRDFATAV